MMNKDSFISPDEFEIVGGFTQENGKLVPKKSSYRIVALCDNLLEKIISSEVHYSILYRDPNDGRYWELIFTEPEFHGGGTRKLTFISDNEAKVKYQLDEI